MLNKFNSQTHKRSRHTQKRRLMSEQQMENNWYQKEWEERETCCANLCHCSSILRRSHRPAEIWETHVMTQVLIHLERGSANSDRAPRPAINSRCVDSMCAWMAWSFSRSAASYRHFLEELLIIIPMHRLCTFKLFPLPLKLMSYLKTRSLGSCCSQFREALLHVVELMWW